MGLVAGSISAKLSPSKTTSIFNSGLYVRLSVFIESLGEGEEPGEAESVGLPVSVSPPALPEMTNVGVVSVAKSDSPFVSPDLSL